VRRDSTVEVQRRLRGGGGDGGATGAESRSSYLEMYMSKKPDKARTHVAAGHGGGAHKSFCDSLVWHVQWDGVCYTRTSDLNLRMLDLQVDPNEERLAKWTRCQLSGEPLTPPCVADELGRLFNKDAVVAGESETWPAQIDVATCSQS